MNLTCNATLDDMRITSEKILVGDLTFHSLARIIAGACTGVAIILSLFLMVMHARYYTRPREQRHIIRILFMVPVYAVASFLQIQFYWHAIYYQVMSDCYESFAIASFFALLCHYVAPDVHSQKEFFRNMKPISPWVLPINWFAYCCGGQRGIWRTPKSGLTWFNIVWSGIYQYCFVRVAMTITAVVTQYFGKYCESSDSPVFAHIWVTVINAISVSIAMYCVIQFYVQMRHALAEHKPFLKVLAIKLVIFLSFWQVTVISWATSTLKIIKPNATLAYPDIKVGIPALLLCIEMALFAIFHVWAFPYAPYKPNAQMILYPVPDPTKETPHLENPNRPPAGGPLGIYAFWDAINIWDLVKAFGRSVRWLFCGVRHRKEDKSYQMNHRNTGADMHDKLDTPSPYEAVRPSEERDYGYDSQASSYPAGYQGGYQGEHQPEFQGQAQSYGGAYQGAYDSGAHGAYQNNAPNAYDPQQAYSPPHSNPYNSRQNYQDDRYDNTAYGR